MCCSLWGGDLKQAFCWIKMKPPPSKILSLIFVCVTFCRKTHTRNKKHYVIFRLWWKVDVSTGWKSDASTFCRRWTIFVCAKKKTIFHAVEKIIFQKTLGNIFENVCGKNAVSKTCVHLQTMAHGWNGRFKIISIKAHIWNGLPRKLKKHFRKTLGNIFEKVRGKNAVSKSCVHLQTMAHGWNGRFWNNFYKGAHLKRIATQVEKTFSLKTCGQQKTYFFSTIFLNVEKRILPMWVKHGGRQKKVFF